MTTTQLTQVLSGRYRAIVISGVQEGKNAV